MNARMRKAIDTRVAMLDRRIQKMVVALAGLKAMRELAIERQQQAAEQAAQAAMKVRRQRGN